MVCCCSVSLPFCCICDLCWYGNSSESPKVEVQLCQQLAEKLLALGGHRRAEFQLGLSQHLPNFFPNYLIPSVFWSLQERSQEGELVGKALLACHRPWGRTQRALQLPLWCRGCLQLWMLFAFCFQALALALPRSTSPAFHLTPRGRRGGRTAPCIGFLRRCLGCCMNACCTCGRISQDCTPSAVLERIEAGEERNSSCFQVFASVVFISLPFFFFLHPKGSFALQVFIKLLSHCGSHHTVTTRTKAKKMQVKEAWGVICLFKEQLDLMGKGENNWKLIFPLGTGCTACLVNSGIGKFMQTCASPPTSQGFHFSLYFSSPPSPLELNSCAAVPPLSASSGLLLKSLPPERVFLLLLGIFPHY